MIITPLLIAVGYINEIIPADVIVATSAGIPALYTRYRGTNTERQEIIAKLVFRSVTMLEGCQGKPRTPTIIKKICPQCGELIELFSIDTQMACEKCGFIACNDTLSCVQWCQYARKCVGDEMYEVMTKIAAIQKAHR